jgi:uncharacterized membrane protein YhaH (DUF805 family)
MKSFRFLFSFNGRISRLPFWLFEIAMSIIAVPAFIYFGISTEGAHTAANADWVVITPGKPPGTEGAHTAADVGIPVYTWTDASGTTHFSNVPHHHGSEKTLVLPMPPAPPIWKTSRSYYVLIIFFVVLWSSFAVQAKRWHDRDKSGWWILINITAVPLTGDKRGLIRP